MNWISNLFTIIGIKKMVDCDKQPTTFVFLLLTWTFAILCTSNNEIRVVEVKYRYQIPYHIYTHNDCVKHLYIYHSYYFYLYIIVVISGNHIPISNYTKINTPTYVSLKLWWLVCSNWSETSDLNWDYFPPQTECHNQVRRVSAIKFNYPFQSSKHEPIVFRAIEQLSYFGVCPSCRIDTNDVSVWSIYTSYLPLFHD